MIVVDAVLRAPTPKPQAVPLFPLQPDVWYKSRNGDFVKRHRDLDHDGGKSWRMHYYKRKNGNPYDWWSITIEDGKHGTGDRHDVVAFADEPAVTPTATLQPAQPHMPDATALIAALMQLNQGTIEASARTVAETVLAAHRDRMRTELATDIAKALEDPISRMVDERVVSQVQVRELIVKDKVETRTVESPHPALAEAIEISRAINNVWLCGPAGSGKTTLAHQLAQSLGLDYAFISCTAGMSEAKLLGRMNVQGAYLPAEFVRIYEEGGVFLWDEFDAADPNVVLCANAAMANGHLSVPDRVDRPCATRHPNTILIVATNTWGRGSTSEYTARETLDAATRDRFVLSKIAVDYAPQIEWQYLGGYDPQQVKPWTCPALPMTLPNVLARIRANIEKHHLRRVMSTRAFAQAAALRALGWDDRKIVERYFLDWTEQERTKALEGVAQPC